MQSTGALYGDGEYSENKQFGPLLCWDILAQDSLSMT